MATTERRIKQILIDYKCVLVSLNDSEKAINNYAIGFGVWLSVNCEQSGSKDGWWLYDKNWKTTDECLEIYNQKNNL